MYDGAVAHKGPPQMPNLLRFGLIFVHFHFPPSSFSPHSLPLPLPFPILTHAKEVNKKLSYRGQNALSVIKTQTQ